MGAPKKLVPVEKVCENCGKTFKAESSYQIRVQRFCSRKCRTAIYGNGRSTTRTSRKCKKCGKQMWLSPHQIPTKNFCSYACGNSYNNTGERNAAWKGGTGCGGKYWKRKCRERDNFTCQYPGCGKYHKGNGIHAHHKIPLSIGGQSSLDNLITLCPKHHKEIEGQLLQRLVEKFQSETKEIIQELYSFGVGPGD